MNEKKSTGKKGKALNIENFIATALEEYKTLRDESKQCSINMFSAFSIGLGVIGIAAISGFSLWGVPEGQFVSLIVFYAFIPIVIGSSVFLWLGEAARFKRVGDYICFIEIKLSLIFKELCKDNNFGEKWEFFQKRIEHNLKLPSTKLYLGYPLVWEQWLRDTRLIPTKRRFQAIGHLGWVYKSRLCSFMAIFALSWIVALILTFKYYKWEFPPTFSYISRHYFILFLLGGIVLLFLVFWGSIYIIGKELETKSKTIDLDEIENEFKKRPRHS